MYPSGETSREPKRKRISCTKAALYAVLEWWVGGTERAAEAYVPPPTHSRTQTVTRRSMRVPGRVLQGVITKIREDAAVVLVQFA